MAAGPSTGNALRRATAPWAKMPVLAALALLAAGCGDWAGGSGATGGRDVVVMAASSLTDVVETVEGSFEAVDGAGRPSITVVTAGSSTLVAQLAAGAGADVLITADAATMDRARSDGSVQGEPIVIATNTLVLATAAGNPGNIAGLEDLARTDLLVGLCAAEVPCGALARTALDEAGITPAADTLEPSVRALAAKIGLGELDGGLVYATDARVAGLATVDAPELDGHVNRYYIAPLAAEPAPPVQAVLDAFTKLGRVGAKALHAWGFGPP